MTKPILLREKGSLRAILFDGQNAREIEEWTGGKFESDTDQYLYLDKGKPGVLTEIEPGTWIIHVPWSLVPYQYVSDALVNHFFERLDGGNR